MLKIMTILILFFFFIAFFHGWYHKWRIVAQARPVDDKLVIRIDGAIVLALIITAAVVNRNSGFHGCHGGIARWYRTSNVQVFEDTICPLSISLSISIEDENTKIVAVMEGPRVPSLRAASFMHSFFIGIPPP